MIRFMQVVFLSVLLMIVGFEGESMANNNVSLNAGEKIPANIINKISNKKVFFGHQSVGFNILDGIKDLDSGNGNKLKIIKSNNSELFKDAIFAHSTIGENNRPDLKMQDFKNAIDGGIGNAADVALFKFCYLDIDKNTDVEKVFSEYRNMMNELKRKYPKTRFAHVTVPLTLSEFSIRNLIKKIIGRPDNNVNRNRYNQMLIKEYANSEPVFDLAGIESTYQDGSRKSFIVNKSTIYSLVPEYAADNGHLNKLGSQIVAGKFLQFLADIEN